MTTRDALSKLLESMPENHLREVFDFARFVSSRAERDAWSVLALEHLERAYGPDEPDYTIADLKPE